MKAYRAQPLTYPWPPALYGLAIFAALYMARIQPITVIGSHGWAPWLAGSAMIVCGVCLDLWAIRTLLDRHTTVMPHRRSSHLVTCGPFRFTRNPSYLAYTLIMIGVGLVTLNPWFFIIDTFVVLVTTTYAVRREELHLHARFGFEYERYCRVTSRWI